MCPTLTDVVDESNSVVHSQTNENASSSSACIAKDSITVNNPLKETDDRFKESSESNLGLDELPHMSIRTQAAQVYLTRTTRLMNAHRAHVQSLRDKCKVGEFVGLRIDKVDRTNTDPKILPCVVVERKDELVKLACVNGIIDQLWPMDALVSLSAVPDTLVDLTMNGLPEISVITASKLFVRGAVNGICCSCKSGCKTKQCVCRKNQVFCSTKCHKNTSGCKNMEE